MYDKNTLKNCILKAIHHGQTGFYFDKDGIYRKIDAEEAVALDLKGALRRSDGSYALYPWYTELPKGTYASQRAQKVLTSFPIGGTLDDFLNQWDNMTVEFTPPMSELERFMARIEPPDIIRLPDNQKPDTFDLINVNVFVLSKTDNTTYIRQHKTEICEYVLDHLANHRSFKKYGVPVNILTMTKMVYSARLKMLQFTFELKPIQKHI